MTDMEQQHKEARKKALKLLEHIEPHGEGII